MPDTLLSNLIEMWPFLIDCIWLISAHFLHLKYSFRLLLLKRLLGLPGLNPPILRKNNFINQRSLICRSTVFCLPWKIANSSPQKTFYVVFWIILRLFHAFLRFYPLITWVELIITNIVIVMIYCIPNCLIIVPAIQKCVLRRLQ